MQKEMNPFEENIFADYPNEAINIAEAAGKLPDMPLKEYISVYAPQLKQNSCCFQCSNSALCSWANGEAVRGWVAREVERSDSAGKSAKIYYCPDFRKDTPHRRFVRYNENSLTALLETQRMRRGNT